MCSSAHDSITPPAAIKLWTTSPLFLSVLMTASMAAVIPTMLAPMADTLDHRNMDFNGLELKRRTFMPVHAAVKVINTTVSARKLIQLLGK